MSSKSMYFLTKDNESLYVDGDSPRFDSDGKLIGFALVLEMSKENVRILDNNEKDLVIEITNPNSELYKHMIQMHNFKCSDFAVGDKVNTPYGIGLVWKVTEVSVHVKHHNNICSKGIMYSKYHSSPMHHSQAHISDISKCK